MGLHTGKVLDYCTKNKTCRTCDHADRIKKLPNKHDCRKNHTGSSKAMERVSAVELFNNAPKKGVKYSSYTGDDDSTIESYIYQQVPYEVEKLSDVVHVKRSLTTRLYNLSKMGRFTSCSSLSNKVIEYLVKCFSIVIGQNKGDPVSVQSSMKCIIPRAFGDHSHCNESWCGWNKNPVTYKHSHLPFGKYLHGESLKSALDDLLAQYCTDAVICKFTKK